MKLEEIVIKDQKETIHRLQKECMEKTEIIEELNTIIQDCNIRRVRLYKILEEIRDLKISQGINDDVLKMINEVLGAEE